MLRVSLATMKARPTNRKFRKSVCTAQRTAEMMKKESSVEVKPIMTGLSDTLKFIKNNMFVKGN